VIRWPLERALNAVGGESLGDPVAFAGVSTDTRTLEPGALYVAIAGENHDGHGFVADALERGAAATIVSDPKAVPAGTPAVVVPDTRRALGALAAAYRRSLSARVVAVTGSAGKTSTVRLLDAALGAGLTGTASPRSYNNDIGVPLTILSARESDDYLVCEIGTSAPGEIALLAAIARPDIAMITSIGRAHLERRSPRRRPPREGRDLQRPRAGRPRPHPVRRSRPPRAHAAARPHRRDLRARAPPRRGRPTPC